MSVIEQYARVHIMTDAAPLPESHRAVPVTLRYDPEADPRHVRVALPGAVPREWVVERDLLEHGLTAPVDRGGTRVWPCGRAQTVVEFHSGRGHSVVEFDTKTLSRFLHLTRVPAAQPVPH
ncbi:SsgA family sporulation/cell division regulator [Streptomyces sp. MA15]|uniref:SsgA family sporulation/cell division regulator n=1 Tax=Streptomyces sp. MA15 TaxID=3055061 RepID=UPI0025B20F9F|nr:SsgA family sporulation/cell division regulator [Streptomyces sp. MA15]MDN3266093.1 SsgA family sporulation/cell division regulator [Streptomyces sp. MA15]